jgi:diguanylate cyclase (GGDEF)-like protein/PAS domain S-box-containing protein
MHIWRLKKPGMQSKCTPGVQALISPKGKLLVVDDDENNRDMFSRRLTRQGYTVEVAAGGSEALEKITAATYDLVLLDQTMPGMTGLDLLRLLRATYSICDLPVIMVTAVDQSETVVEALNGGANDYVVKPVDLPVMSARIEAQLARSRSEQKSRENEEQLALAMRGGSDAIWVIDLVSGDVRILGEWLARLGWETSEIGNTLDAYLALVHSEDVTRLAADLEAAIENRIPEFHCEFRFRSKEGKYRWVLARGSVHREESGKPLRIAGSITDLAGRKSSDALTGLGNRPMLLDAINEAEQPFTLLLLDVDDFRQINDIYGTAIGDRVLLEIGRRIRRTVATSSFSAAIVSRIGGDEFTVLFTEPCSPDQVHAFSGELLAQISQPLLLDEFEFTATASAGIVIAEPGHSKAERVLRDAELAVYAAREIGKNMTQLFVLEMRELAHVRMELIRDLPRAIESGQFCVFYQSKVDLKTLRIVGFEALLRWRHPERGMIDPLRFIPLAEESGLIIPIGEWILREATRQLAAWQRIMPLSMNVNLSVKQLADANLVERIHSILRETRIAPQTLKLELTESALMTNIEEAGKVIEKLQTLGIGLKLDDFGTGYSSLSYLQSLHFNSLKIDRSFISKLTEDPETHAIVDTIIKLAHALGMTVVAEGIEEQKQLGELLRLGCDIGQGYYFSRPVDADTAGKLLLEDLKRR